MGIFDIKPILELPIASKDISLENRIKEHFGESGLARFKEHNIMLKVSVHPDYPFWAGFAICDLRGQPPCTIKGKVYEIYSKYIQEVRADNASIVMFREPLSLFLTLDLNPGDETARYLRLIFNFEK